MAAQTCKSRSATATSVAELAACYRAGIAFAAIGIPGKQTLKCEAAPRAIARSSPRWLPCAAVRAFCAQQSARHCVSAERI